MHEDSDEFLLIKYFEFKGGGGRNLKCPSTVLHFLLVGVCFIHKNEQILLSDEMMNTFIKNTGYF